MQPDSHSANPISILSQVEQILGLTWIAVQVIQFALIHSAQIQLPPSAPAGRPHQSKLLRDSHPINTPESTAPTVPITSEESRMATLIEPVSYDLGINSSCMLRSCSCAITTTFSSIPSMQCLSKYSAICSSSITVGVIRPEEF